MLATACSMIFLSAVASPTPMFSVIFEIRGVAIALQFSCFCSAGAIFCLYCVCRLAMTSYRSTTSPFDLNTRTFLRAAPSPITLKPTRSPFLVAGFHSARLDASSGISFSMMPPATPAFGFGFWCFLTTLMPSTSTLPAGSTALTVPWRPLSLPVVTTTSSPLRILFMASSDDFRRQRHDLHEAVAQFARDRPEDAGADGLELGVDQHGRVGVEADGRAVVAADREARAHDDGVVHFALLDLAARNRVLDRDLDDVADVRVAAMRGARDADHLHHARAAVVGGDEVAFLLDHGRGLR